MCIIQGKVSINKVDSIFILSICLNKCSLNRSPAAMFRKAHFYLFYWFFLDRHVSKCSFSGLQNLHWLAGWLTQLHLSVLVCYAWGTFTQLKVFSSSSTLIGETAQTTESTIWTIPNRKAVSVCMCKISWQHNSMEWPKFDGKSKEVFSVSKFVFFFVFCLSLSLSPDRVIRPL